MSSSTNTSRTNPPCKEEAAPRAERNVAAENDLAGTVRQDEASRGRAEELSLRDLDPPAHVPGYAILRQLGEGAYGSVWLATERNTGKQVAIKFYSHRRGLDWSLLSREVEKLAVLYTSRNIVGLLDVGWNSDPPFYVMEYLENGSVSSLLESGPLPAHEAVRITRSVLQALVHAHGSGILHCDLKPANVLLDADYEPRLCDFGQSRLSDEQNPALGTLFYMAPEQADLHAVPDARWDVYALGALLYHLLTGEAPYRTAENERRIREAGGLVEKLAEYRRIVRQDPRPQAHRQVRGVDRRLAEIVERCLHVDPERRFPNAQAVLDALDERERQRARRPLMVLGVIFPVILLLLMSPVAKQAGSRAVETASRTLTDSALESNVLSANIMAHNIRLDLQLRTDELVQITEQIDLAALLRRNQQIVAEMESDGWDKLSAEEQTARRRLFWKQKREPLFRRLEELRRESDQRRRKLRLSADRSWFLTDAAGYQRWRSPVDIEHTLDRRYHYRDYFHGRHREYRPDHVPDDLTPIERPHVSLAFRSQSTKRFMVAISVPIRDRQTGEVVGILARTMDLGELLTDYSTGLQLKGRSVVLVENQDGKLLDHPWMTKAHLAELEQTDPELQSLTLDEQLQQRIQKLSTGLSSGNGKEAASAATRQPADSPARTGPRPNLRLSEYTDPVGRLSLTSAEPYRGTWLAACAPVGGATGWTVIVQEHKSLALEPIGEMERGLIRSGIWAFLLFIGLIIAVWTVVVWKMNDRSLRLRGTQNGKNDRQEPDSLSPPRSAGSSSLSV